MTIETMIDMMSMEIGDLFSNKFPPDLKVALLNRAQSKVISLVERHILEELDEKESSQALDDTYGYIDLTGLTYDIRFKNKGIDGIQITDGYFCNKISFEEYRKYVDMDKVFTSDKPVYYVRGNYAYIQPFDDDTTVDVYYMREAVSMALAADPADNVDCELDNELHEPLIKIAAYYGCSYIGPDERNSFNNFEAYRRKASDLWAIAMEEIKEINLKYPPTDSVRLGINRFINEDDYGEDQFPVIFNQYTG